MTRHTLPVALVLATLPWLVGCFERPDTPPEGTAEPTVEAPRPSGDPVITFGGERPDGAVAGTSGAATPPVEPPPAVELSDRTRVEVDPRPGTPPADVRMVDAWNGTAVGHSPDGREVWIAWDGEPGYHATLVGELPDGARLLPLLETEGYTDLELLLVRPGAPEAEVLPWWQTVADAPTRRMWVAPAPGSTGEGQALRDTVALRYLRTCPGLMETCALYGAPADVEAAEDPVAPLGGWFLRWDHAELSPSAGAEWTTVATYASDDLPGTRLEVEATREPREPRDGSAEDDPYPEHLHRAWLVHRGRRTHAFDFLAPVFEEMGTGGVTRDGDRLVAWLWRADFVALDASEHDARTGRRLGAPLAATAEPYFDVECGYVLYNTRPMPVRTPTGELGVALYWGTDGALYFERDAERGHFVATGVEPETLEPWGDDVPDILHLDPVRAAIDEADLYD